MSLTSDSNSSASSTAKHWLWAGLLGSILCFGIDPAWARGTVLFEDHFDDVSSLENWGLDGALFSLDDQMLNFWTCTWGVPCGQSGGGVSGDSHGLLKRDPERNFEVSVKLWPVDVPQGRIMLGPYELVFSSTEGDEPGVAMRYNHATLTRFDFNGSISSTVAEADFAPVNIPVTARVVASVGTIRAFLGGKQVLDYADYEPTIPGRIGLGQSSTGVFGNVKVMRFDDFVLKALPDIRCSRDATVDDRDSACSGGLFDHRLWAYLGPDQGKIAQVEFYLDGRFHRREFYAPWELDGGKATNMTSGPHEIKARVRYKDGNSKMMSAGFEVGEHSLRCSSDPILDGKDRACEGAVTSGPQWVYWWPKTNIESVDFYFNSSQITRTENWAPFELGGGEPLHSDGYGQNYVRSVVRFRDGRNPLTTDTQFSNHSPLLCSIDPILDGNDDGCWELRPWLTWIYWWPEAGISSIDFYLDDIFYRTERHAPFELDDGAGNPLGLATGPHTIRMVVTYEGRTNPVTVEQGVYVTDW